VDEGQGLQHAVMDGPGQPVALEVLGLLLERPAHSPLLGPGEVGAVADTATEQHDEQSVADRFDAQ